MIRGDALNIRRQMRDRECESFERGKRKTLRRVLAVLALLTSIAAIALAAFASGTGAHYVIESQDGSDRVTYIRRSEFVAARFFIGEQELWYEGTAGVFNFDPGTGQLSRYYADLCIAPNGDPPPELIRFQQFPTGVWYVNPDKVSYVEELDGGMMRVALPGVVFIVPRSQVGLNKIPNRAVFENANAPGFFFLVNTDRASPYTSPIEPGKLLGMGPTCFDTPANRSKLGIPQRGAR